MNLTNFLGLLAFAFFHSIIAQAQSIGSADETWKIIKTPHFDVVVSAKHHDLGLYYAHVAEKAYARLATVYQHRPEKTVLIVNDTTDITNGYATRIPYPHIMAYAVPVGEHDSLSEAGDWPRELLIHELTHILQFEPATGFYSALRPVFGSIVAPNLLMPLWWKEGMAVEMETQFTPRGRLRSTYQDAMLRSFVLSNSLDKYDLPQANEALSTWPYGSRPYIFGSLFFSQLNHETKSLQSTSYLVDRQGGRVPYFIETPLQELTQKTYPQLYTDALAAAEKNARSQLRKLQLLPTTKMTPVAQENLSSFRPSYSRRFDLLAYIENVDGKNRIAVQNNAGETLKLKKIPTGEISTIQFHPIEKKILYTKTDKFDSKHIYSDLYEYDLDSEKSERLTHAQRARSATYSDDGTQVVFITTFGGQTQLRTFDVAAKKTRFIINSTLAYRYESPVFWDQNTLLAAKVDGAGVYSLVRIDLSSKVETPLPLSFKQSRFLKKINNRLYFVSSQNGVNNIYRSDDLQSAQPVTHLQTGAWSYEVSADEKTAWASLMTESGFKITALQLEPVTAPLPEIQNEIAARYRYEEPESVHARYPVTDYAAGPYLWPRYWIPFVSTSTSSRGIFLMAQTTGHDPLNKHMYALAASYDSDLNRGNFSGLYLNSTLSVPFQISSIINSRALGTADDIVQTTTHAVSVLPDVFAINKHLTAELGVHLQETEYLTSSQHAGPFAQLMYRNYEQTIFQISPESGWGALLRHERNTKVSDDSGFIARDYDRTVAGFTAFASPWLPKRHAVKLHLGAHWTSPDVFARYGVSSASSFYEQDGIAPQFVNRGYAPAQFYGHKMWTANIEYRFPIHDIDTGSGSDPYFLRRLTGALVADGLALKGTGLDKNLTTLHPLDLNESIWSTGAELKLETTIGYVLPVNFVLGYYHPHSPLFASGGQLGVSLQIGGF